MPRAPVVAHAGYGDTAEFRDAITARGLSYAVGMAGTVPRTPVGVGNCGPGSPSIRYRARPISLEASSLDLGRNSPEMERAAPSPGPAPCCCLAGMQRLGTAHRTLRHESANKGGSRTGTPLGYRITCIRGTRRDRWHWPSPGTPRRWGGGCRRCRRPAACGADPLGRGPRRRSR